ncbi:MAG TPA: hypothetical protein VLF39_02345 [Candidatus Saccharimonadales bacterium]|nr:hypothetical protein [Candidatus Saccharimonadales bacterium]
MSELLLDPEQQLELAVHLYTEGLFGIEEDPEKYARLKSERMSPHYFDARPGISDVETRDLIIGNMVDLAQQRAIDVSKNENIQFDEIYDHFAGTPEAMTSYAAMIADQTEMSLLQPRVDLFKTTGNKTPILGRFNQGDRVAEFDDVVTDGASKISTIKALGEAGLTVVDYFVVLDREEGGAPQVLSETGVEITPALGVASMVKILQAEELISATQFDNVKQYIEEFGDPHAKAELGIVA